MDGLSLFNDLLFTPSLYFFCLIHCMPYRMELFRWNLLEIRVSSIIAFHTHIYVTVNLHDHSMKQKKNVDHNQEN